MTTRRNIEFDMIVRMTLDGQKHDAPFIFCFGNNEFTATWLPTRGRELEVSGRDTTASGAIRKLYTHLREKGLIEELKS